MSKRSTIFALVTLALLAGALIYAKPWESSNPFPAPTTQVGTPEPTELFTSPRSGKKHPFADYKPAPARPGWVICPDTQQPFPIASLKP